MKKNETRHMTRIKKIFKDPVDAKKENVNQAIKNNKQNLDERKEKHHTKHKKKSWAHRLFYGPGTIWGGGGCGNASHGPGCTGGHPDCGAPAGGPSSGGSSGGAAAGGAAGGSGAGGGGGGAGGGGAA